MTAEERRGELIEIWTKATNEVAKELEVSLPQDNPLWTMINSGARGNMLQLRQISCDPWSGRQPEGRDHPAADQGQLPRGPLGAGVLHLHATVPARVWPTPRCGRPTPVI